MQKTPQRTDAEALVVGRIKKLRTMLLAFRYLYYALSESIVTDFVYDQRELELRMLVTQYPELAAAAPYADCCPTETVGSSDSMDYPLEVLDLAESLLYTHEQLAGATCPPPACTTEELHAMMDAIEAQMHASATAQPGLF